MGNILSSLMTALITCMLFQLGNRLLLYKTTCEDDAKKYKTACEDDAKFVEELHIAWSSYDSPLDERWKQYISLKKRYDEAGERNLFYQAERSDDDLLQIMLLGRTGVGKSTFGNRLAGYQRNPVRSNKGFFGISPDLDSCTQYLSKLSVNDLYSDDVTIIDAPGQADSNGSDLSHLTNSIEYLRGSGGVNAFVVVTRMLRLDQHDRAMLNEFQDMFGKMDFWSHVLIVVNLCGDSNVKEWTRNENEYKRDFSEKLMDIYELEESPPIIGLDCLGKYGYRLQLRDLVENIPSERLSGERFSSPMEALEVQMSTARKKLETMQKKRSVPFEELQKRCAQFDDNVANLKWFKGKWFGITKILFAIDYEVSDSLWNRIQNVKRSACDEIRPEFNCSESNHVKSIIELRSETVEYKKHPWFRAGMLADESGRKFLSCARARGASDGDFVRLQKKVKANSSRRKPKLFNADDFCSASSGTEFSWMYDCCSQDMAFSDAYNNDDGLRFPKPNSSKKIGWLEWLGWKRGDSTDEEDEEVKEENGQGPAPVYEW